jgi:hypothetical protein
MLHSPFTASVIPHQPAAHDQARAVMTRERLKEKLRAHGVLGWSDELSGWVQREEGLVRLATWENEGGSTDFPAGRR